MDNKVNKITKLVMQELNRLVKNASDEGKWITIKPHGEDSEDYRRLKLEKGETPKQAIERVYKKDDADKEEHKLSEQIKSKTKDYKEKKEQLVKLERSYKKLTAQIQDVRMQEMGLKDRVLTGEQMKNTYDEYIKVRSEHNNLIIEINVLAKEINTLKIEEMNKLIKNINIEKSLKAYNTDDIVEKLEKVNKDFDYNKMRDELDKIEKEITAKREEFRKYIKEAKNNEEYKSRTEEYYKWAEKSQIAQKRREQMEKITKFKRDKNRAISNALQYSKGGEFKLTTSKGSVLTNKIEETNKLLSGLVNKEYLKDYSAVAKGFRGLRANGSANLIQLNSMDSTTTAIHECMHSIEDTNPKMLANSKAFLEYRTKNDAEKSLRNLTGNKGYKANEVAKADNFFSPYCGKKYDYGTEIMSMGLQRIFEEPEKFYKEDREYFNFVIGNLRGEL